ncbi:Vasopressin V1a receptor like protein [Argiope bruennichi]|uniref:Vasopressin V1a receptor like protein n=1 Tax=Argiope bruennichi TaxID=94029 RepID=A0A8T0F7K1_ARGBR|nr:Vasopressin V1a receptor like protein [Argiope bruennichi]
MRSRHQILCISAVWMAIATLIMIPSSTEDSINYFNASLSSAYEGTNFVDIYHNVTVYPEGAVWNAELIQRVVTLAIIMTATLVGNTIIVLVLSRSRYRKRSSRVNIFILNLAIGDLAVCLITMTSELLFEVSVRVNATHVVGGISGFGEWILGAPRESNLFTGKSVNVGQHHLHPDHHELRPIFIFVQKENGITETGRIRYECVSRGYTAPWQRKVYFMWLTFYILIIPAGCISYCYINVLRTVWAAGQEQSRTSSKGGGASGTEGPHSTIRLRRSFNAASTIPRAKIKTLKLTVCIIASFIICWTPYFIVHNIRIFSNYTIKVPKTVIIGAETFALLNSALNPIFYGYFNVRVRKGFIEIVYRKKEFNRDRVCNGMSGETSYSSTILQHMENRPPTTQMVLEMSEFTYRGHNNGGPYYRTRRSPRSMKRRSIHGNSVARL